ncbi:DDB1- and CUL4-associated factor 6-like [Tubulanus polymorphus]|uniref:DDB1- and CUL4-associated factor 6-like n=1 Tax=Tubulanus polymorphus TaxID=672921 RepID=UPI003DA20BA7
MNSFWQQKENLYLGLCNNKLLQKSAKDDLNLLQRLRLEDKIEAHSGCVNTICWNDNGSLLLSGSDDQHLAITNPFTKKTLFSVHSGHRANIFSAKFLPNCSDQKIVSCSGDGIIYVTQIDRAESYGSFKFDCHFGTVYEVITVENDCHTFLTCGEDGTVRWFDQRIKSHCNKTECREDVLISCRGAVSALSINPMAPYQLAIGCSDSVVRLYDRRFLGTKATGNSSGNGVAGMFSCFTAPGLEKKSHRITSVKFDSMGQKLLVSYSSDYLYLFDMTENVKKKLSVKDNSTRSAVNSDNIETVGTNEAQPPIKRLRLRGDWSDTGPGARPESERNSEGTAGRTSLMQRMSEMLTRWFEDRIQQDREDSGQNDDQDHPPNNENEQEIIEGQEQRTSENESNSESQAGILQPVQQQIDAGHDPNESSSIQRTLQNVSDQSISEPQANDESSIYEAHSSNNVQKQSDNSENGSASSNIDPQPSSSTTEMNTLPSTSSLPVINLEYSTQGMNNSTVVLGFESEDCSPVNSAAEIPLIKVPRYQSTAVNTGNEEPSQSHEADEEPQPSTSHQQPTEDRVSPQIELTNISDDEDDSDDEQPIPVPQRPRDPSDMARKIQRMYRRRQEEKRLEEEALHNTWQPRLERVFRGHRNARTMIKEANFWGDRYVISGSDCGHIFFWNQQTGKLVNLLEGDKHVVNCVQPHPFDPILASSGIDYDIKLWAPSSPDCVFAADEAQELMSRNEVMLEETRDTITVPASFMLRMLASLNHIRSGRRAREVPTESTSSSDNENL